ncbi:MAG: OmpA/MotB family protein [Gammaproteobacteria bacterium]
MKVSRALVLLPVLLAGCSARLSSSLPPAAMPASYVGAQAGVLAPEALGPAVDGLQRELEQVAKAKDVVSAQLSRDGEVLKLRIGADQTFGPASAELRPTALEFYAEVAQVLARQPGTVAHIVVHAEVASGEPATDLTARRAASLQSYFLLRGLPGTRVRAEGRGSAQRLTPDAAPANRRIELVIKPIVSGREAEAWAPPS